MNATARGIWPRLRRELGREMQRPDPFVRLIIVERCAKGVLLSALGTVLVVYHRHLGGFTEWLQQELNLGSGRNFFQRLVEAGLERLGAVRPATAVLIGFGALIYAALEFTEGIGLARRRRWAEYLTVLATAFFIPFELLEVARRVTVLRMAALLFNVLVVVYLAWRKRLFVGE